MPARKVPAPKPPAPGLRLRYLWDSQMILAVDEVGSVQAAEPLARLIVQATRRKALLPSSTVCAYELDAIREAVVAEAQLAGRPAPPGWARRIHGKAIDGSNPRQDLGLGEPSPAGPLGDDDAR